jgi:hypothetical protein
VYEHQTKFRHDTDLQMHIAQLSIVEETERFKLRVESVPETIGHSLCGGRDLRGPVPAAYCMDRRLE